MRHLEKNCGEKIFIFRKVTARGSWGRGQNPLILVDFGVFLPKEL